MVLLSLYNRGGGLQASWPVNLHAFLDQVCSANLEHAKAGNVTFSSRPCFKLKHKRYFYPVSQTRVLLVVVIWLVKRSHLYWRFYEKGFVFSSDCAAHRIHVHHSAHGQSGVFNPPRWAGASLTNHFVSCAALCIIEIYFHVFQPFLIIIFFCCVSVFTGRWLMSFWMGNSKIHELYTAACGLYVCWLSIRGATVLLAWMPQGRTVIMRKVQEWTMMVGISEQTEAFEHGHQSFHTIVKLHEEKTEYFDVYVYCTSRSWRPLLWLCWLPESFHCYWACCLSWWSWLPSEYLWTKHLCFIPGRYDHLCFLFCHPPKPWEVSKNTFMLWSDLQDWALGVLHAKIIAAITLMGPQWWLKTVIEQVVQQNGIWLSALFFYVFLWDSQIVRDFPKIAFVAHFSGLCKRDSQHWSPLHHPKAGGSRHLSAAVVPVCAVRDRCRGGARRRSVSDLCDKVLGCYFTA